MSPDPRWLELLKTSGWQTTFLAIGCGIFLLLINARIVIVDAWPWVVPLVTGALVLFLMLALASIGQAVSRGLVLPASKWVRRRIARYKVQRALAAYIPYMTGKERKIIGYLLKHRLKTFTVDQDGGHAATLISRGIVSFAVRHGQMVDFTRVPVIVPDYLWKVLEAHRDQFPHVPEMDGNVEMHPWRMHYLER